MKYTIKVIPKSSQTKIIEQKDDYLKIKLKAMGTTSPEIQEWHNIFDQISKTIIFAHR